MTSQTNTPPPHHSSTTTTANITRVLIDFNLWGIIQLLVISTKTETHLAVSLGLWFRQPNIRMQNLLRVRNKDGRPFWPDFGYFGLFGLSGRKTIGGVKTIEMWWWWWWRENNRNVVVVAYSFTIYRPETQTSKLKVTLANSSLLSDFCHLNVMFACLLSLK